MSNKNKFSFKPTIFESNQHSLLLFTFIYAVSFATVAEEAKTPIVAVEPNKPVTSVQAAAIDTERFELGALVGALSVEDFNTNSAAGLSLTYHVNHDVIGQLHYGNSNVSKAAFERNANGNFLASDNYNFQYVSLLAGYKLVDGRSFFGRRHKFNSAIYFLGGISSVSFADNNELGAVFGLSYRTVITDWLTTNVDFHDVIVNRSFLQSEKQTHNTQLSLGVNFLF